MADYPVVPLDKVVGAAQHRHDRPQPLRQARRRTIRVYLVGSDRISTELHNLNEDANASLSKPMTLDYEMNDPADPESIYTRSDHYSYASKGIPIIFYTTGLHRDYHYVTDEVDEDRVPEDGAHRAARVHDRATASRTSITSRRGTTRGRGKGRAPTGRSRASAR